MSISYSNISNVNFSLYNTIDNLKNSNVAINNYELLSAEGEPVNYGVYDKKLGSIEQGYLCCSCFKDKRHCTGHCGHIELKISVIQPIGISECRKWLRITCFKCGNIMVDRDRYINFDLSKRLTEASLSDVSGKKCNKCNTVHYKVIKEEDDNFTFSIELVQNDLKTNRIKLYPDTIKAIFERISDIHIEELGKNHPKDLIIKTIRVSPTTIRPGIRSFTGSGITYHDSTNIYQRIIKCNNSLPNQLPDAIGEKGPFGVVDIELNKNILNIHQLIYDLILGSNSTSALQGTSGKRGIVIGGRPINSILRALSSKTGRIRGNILGKRVFYMSRTTISGNTKYKLNEVGLPLEFARTLQIEEVVQEYNKDALMVYFLNGRRQYPGCTQIKRKDTLYDISRPYNLKLEIGDIVFRDVITGDYAYMNRQPTLERSSMGVHRIIVIQDPSVHTIQFNVSSCVWYNADFDGDQMNLWVPRSVAARAEAEILSQVHTNYISINSSSPVNGQVQDGVVGCYNLTKSGVLIDKYHAMELFSYIGNVNFTQFKSDYKLSGREIISLLLETTPINYIGTPDSFNEVYANFIEYDKDETKTIIERGKMLTGVLDKKSIGGGIKGGLFHLIGLEYGNEKALEMIYNFQQVVLKYLIFKGFSIGISDMIPSKKSLDEIKILVSDIIGESNLISQQLIAGHIFPPIDKTIIEYYEELQKNALQVDTTEIMRITLQNMKINTNGLFNMIKCGSVGTNANFIYISGVIGQTLIEGDRIDENFSLGRTMPYFPRFSTDPTARGFVKNNFITGMTSPEFICQSMKGRCDLIKKALETASGGYFTRKGTMNNQSSIIDNYGRVVKDVKIIQLNYAETGYDTRAVEDVNIRTIKLTSEKLDNYIMGDLDKMDKIDKSLIIKNYIKMIKDDRLLYCKIFMNLEQISFDSTFKTNILLPLSVKTIVDNTIILGKDLPKFKTTISIIENHIDLVLKLCNRLQYAHTNEIQENKKAIIPNYRQSPTLMLQILIKSELTPFILSKLNNEQLVFILNSIFVKYKSSFIAAGTSIGIIAAQAISTPLTQAMLDSHKSTSGTQSGLVRISEIYGAKSVEQESNPQMLLFPAKSGLTQQEVSVLANSIEFLSIKYFVINYDCLLEPFENLKYDKYSGDSIWIEQFKLNHPLIQKPNDLTNWCFRLELNKINMILKSISLEYIIQQLQINFPNTFIVYNPETSKKIIVRIWFKSNQFKKISDINKIKIQNLLDEVLDFSVRGIRGIISAKEEKIKFIQIDKDGNLIESTEYCVRTNGTNMTKMLYNKDFDPLRMISSSIDETYKLLGINPARQKIISETFKIITKKPPTQHIILYADEMTQTGKITSIERAGLSSREYNNVLLRMAYGSPIQVVCDAALNNVSSKVYGVAASLMLGNTPQIGTLYNKLTVNQEFVKKNTTSLDDILDNLI